MININITFRPRTLGRRKTKRRKREGKFFRRVTSRLDLDYIGLDLTELDWTGLDWTRSESESSSQLIVIVHSTNYQVDRQTRPKKKKKKETQKETQKEKERKGKGKGKGANQVPVHPCILVRQKDPSCTEKDIKIKE